MKMTTSFLTQQQILAKTTLRECKFILPVLSRHGNPLAIFHAGVRGDLCKTFGGYTETICAGGYKDKDGSIIYENNVQYTVLCNEEDSKVLVEKVRTWGAVIEQECVYFIGFDGVGHLLQLQAKEHDVLLVTRLTERNLANGG